MMGPAVAFVGGSGAWQGFGTIRRAATAVKVPLVWRASEGSEGLAAVPVGGGGAWQGFEPTRRATSAAKVPQMWRAPEGSEGTRGPGCGARGRWRGLAGLRADVPSRRLAARTARGRAAAHGAARPSRAHQAAPLIDTRIQAERPASRVARWTPPRPASWAAWVRHENPSARYTALGCADRDGSRECDATATDRS